MRALDIAVFIWMFKIVVYVVYSTLGLQAPSPEMPGYDVSPGDLLNPAFWFGTFVQATVAGGVLGLYLFLTERGGFLILGIIAFAGIFITLKVLSTLIGPVFGLGTTINNIFTTFFVIPGVNPVPQLPPAIVDFLNAYGYFITLLAVADIFAGRRMRDLGI